jgi:hypothetical protein
MTKHDAVLAWRSRGRGALLTPEALAESMTCENLPYEHIPDAMCAAVTAFRHLRSDARIAACRSFLAPLPAPALRQRRGEAVEKASEGLSMTLADAVDAAAANVELRAKLVRLMAEWQLEAAQWRAAAESVEDALGTPNSAGPDYPDYASGLLSAWDDLRDALGVAV